VDELAFPPAGAHELILDRFARQREYRMQQLVRNLAERLLAGPPISFLGDSVPIGDGLVEIADENGLMRDIEQAPALPRRYLGHLVEQGEVRGDADRSQADDEVDESDGRRPPLQRYCMARDGVAAASQGHEQDVAPWQKSGRNQHHGDVEHRQSDVERGQRVENKDPGRDRTGKDRNDD
jgi:hypothetical protein